MDERRLPVLLDPWLGVLHRHGFGELVGSIEVDPVVRRARPNGDRDVEVLFEVSAGHSESVVRSHLLACSEQLRVALEQLPSIKLYAVAHAPTSWAAERAAGSQEELLDVLFLDGMEVDLRGRVSLVFDYGDLDQLVVRLDEQGQGEAVFLRP